MENNTTKPFYNTTIPSDWEIKKLKDILIEGRLGGNYENAEANNGIPVIKMGNLDRGVIKTDKIQYLPENELFNKEDVLKEGDLLFNTRNTLELVGKVAIWKKELPFAVYNSNLMRMKFDGKLVESNWFMNYAFNSHYGLSQLRGIATGTTSVAAIYGRDLESIKFLLPPLSEQRAIAHILGLMDAAINQNNQLIAQKELRKKWLMQNLLTGKKRLKGFGGEWKEVKLGKLFKQIKNINDGGDSHSIMTISSKLGLISQQDKFDKVIAGDSLKKYTQLKKEDFAYNKGNSKTYQMGCIYQLEEKESALVPFVYICFSPTDLVDTKFYKHWFFAHGLDRQLKKIITSGARGDGLLNVNSDDFFTLKVPYPPKEEQTAIAQLLQTADKEIQLLKAKTDKLREQKKGMMQVLLTGKKRLKIGNE
jgi:type I restriction enzyme S subunit